MYKNGIPQFDGQKYAFWIRRMKTYIHAQRFEIWQSVEMDTKNQQFRPQMKEQLNSGKIIPKPQMHF
jgi:hypothetical protein